MLTIVILRCVLGIGCAGEIRVSEHEDYEKWAIDILVKFRSTEKLQLLTGQRQSGGVSGLSMLLRQYRFKYMLQERSLTTILYLMSLTEEARAPFSLVDEINQVRSKPQLLRNCSPSDFRVWINEPNGTSTTRWST